MINVKGRLTEKVVQSVLHTVNSLVRFLKNNKKIINFFFFKEEVLDRNE